MMLRHCEWDFVFPFKENVIQWLTIEEPTVFRNLVWEMKRQCQGESGGFVLSESSRPVPISSKLALVTDPFSVDINNRKAITSLHKHIAAVAVDEDHYLGTQEMISCFFQYLEGLFSEIHSPLTLDYDAGVEKLFKAYDVRFETEDSSLPELFLDFSCIMTDFCGVEVFVFCNLTSCLTLPELSSLIREWHSAKIPVLLIDTVASAVENEMNRWIIDADKCLINA